MSSALPGFLLTFPLGITFHDGLGLKTVWGRIVLGKKAHWRFWSMIVRSYLEGEVGTDHEPFADGLRSLGACMPFSVSTLFYLSFGNTKCFPDDGRFA